MEHNIILDCDIKILLEVLTQAQQVGLVADKYNFIVCTLVSQILNFCIFYERISGKSS